MARPIGALNGHTHGLRADHQTVSSVRIQRCHRGRIVHNLRFGRRVDASVSKPGDIAPHHVGNPVRLDAADVRVHEYVSRLLGIGYGHTHGLKNVFHCRPHVLLLDADGNRFGNVKPL
jgi:hypothetical protein